MQLPGPEPELELEPDSKKARRHRLAVYWTRPPSCPAAWCRWLGRAAIATRDGRAVRRERRRERLSGGASCMDLDELDDLASFESADDTDSEGDDPGRNGGHGSGAKGQTLALRAAQHLAKQPLQRTGADLDELLEWVLSVRFFRDNARSSFMRREICRCLRLQRVAAGAVICNQGDPGDAFFVIITGSIKITVNGVEMPPLLTKSGTGLGERALAEESVRSNVQQTAAPAHFTLDLHRAHVLLR